MYIPSSQTRTHTHTTPTTARHRHQQQHYVNDYNTAARRLYERVGVFTVHLQKVGSNLTKATESYNSAVASLETRVMPSARRFETLAVAADQALPGVSPVDVTTRQVSLPELEAGSGSDL